MLKTYTLSDKIQGERKKEV